MPVIVCLAGIARLHHLIRRKASDVYEDFESDERVLNSATGHRSSDTRRKKYQQRDRPEILAKTAETRRRVRSEAFGRQSLNGDAGPAT